jgi:hypothetical protein
MVLPSAKLQLVAVFWVTSVQIAPLSLLIWIFSRRRAPKPGSGRLKLA